MLKRTSHGTSTKWPVTRDKIKTWRQAGEQRKSVHQAWFNFFLDMLSAFFSI